MTPADPAQTAALAAYVKLLRANRSVIARVEPGLAREGLTLTQLGVLEVLLHKGPLGHRDIGRKLLTSPANLSDVIGKLETRGLVRRERVAGDRRRLLVELTAPGRALIERVFPAHAADIAAAMAGLNATELSELGELLRRLGTAAQQPGSSAPT